VLPGGAAAEVPAGYQNVAGVDFLDESSVDVLHAVLGQLFGVGGV